MRAETDARKAAEREAAGERRNRSAGRAELAAASRRTGLARRIRILYPGAIQFGEGTPNEHRRIRRRADAGRGRARQPEPPPRIATLDIVRGIAVMGILAMNIVAFAMPFQAYVNPIAYGLESDADLASWVFSFIFVDGKMRGLFSFLFGASMLLVIERAEAAGRVAGRGPLSADALAARLRPASISTSSGSATSSPLYALIGLIAFFFRNLGARAGHLGRSAFVLLQLC